MFPMKTSLIFSSKAPQIVFLKKKMFSVRIRTMWHVWGQNCSQRKLRSFFPRKPPKSFFRKRKRFRFEFLYETTLLPILRCNRLCGTIRGKIVPDKNFARIYPPKIIFPNITFAGRIFLRNRPLPIFCAKRTMWRVSGLNYSKKKLRSFLLGKPPKSFF